MDIYEVQVTINSYTFQYTAYMTTFVKAGGPIDAKRKARERVARRAAKGEYGPEFTKKPVKIETTVCNLVCAQLSLI
jgi:hypothetical protein